MGQVVPNLRAAKVKWTFTREILQQRCGEDYIVGEGSIEDDSVKKTQTRLPLLTVCLSFDSNLNAQVSSICFQLDISCANHIFHLFS